MSATGRERLHLEQHHQPLHLSRGDEVNKIKVALLMGLALVLAACGSANESGEKAAGCEGKQSYVISREGINGQGHLMLVVACREGDASSNWYVTWPDPKNEDQLREYNSYKVGDPYP
jgi:hypothetical protein